MKKSLYQEETLLNLSCPVLQCILENRRIALTVINDQGHIVLWQTGMTTLFGYSGKEVNGKKLDQIIMTRGALHEGRDIVCAGKTNKEMNVRIKLSSDFNDAGKKTVLIFEDITNEKKITDFMDNYHDTIQKELEQAVNKKTRELQDLNETLEEKVKTRTNELSRKNRELMNALEREKVIKEELVESEKMASLGKMVSHISHELNTPLGLSLTALDGIRHEAIDLSGDMEKAESGREKQFAESTSNIIELAKIADSSLKRSVKIINTLKNLSYDQNVDNRRSIDLVSYIKDVVFTMKPQWSSDGHSVEISGETVVSIDTYPGAVYQIFSNLINNSLIHGFSDMKNKLIEIMITKENDTVRIRFQNNGKYIPEKKIEKVFTPFFTTREKEGGTGIGLSIVYSLIVGKMQGTIVCRNRSDKQGVCFEMELPVKAAITASSENKREND